MNEKTLTNNHFKISVRSAFIYFLLTFSLLLIFLTVSASPSFYEIVEDIFATFCAVFLFGEMLYFYMHRVKYISLQLMFAFVFSLIIGIPSFYLYFFKKASNGFELACIWGMLINIILYLTAIKSVHRQQIKTINGLFKVIFLIVGACQLIKIIFYLKFILSSGLGHLAIYTDSEELLASIPFLIRAISGFSSIMALAVFYYKSSKKYKVFAFILLASDLIIGIRNKFFFAFICIIILSLYSNRKKITAIFARISKLQYLLIGFVGFSIISYLREGYEINFISYLGIVLDSLSSTLAGLQNIYSLPDENGWALLNPNTIISQVFPLSGFGFISDAQIAHEYSTIVLGNVDNGIALSSSGLLEASIISLHFSLFVYLAYLLIMISIIQKGLNSNYAIFNFFALAMMTGFFYSVRGELILPFAYVLKSLPIILIANLLIQLKSRN
ncbi:oligosaccharide repeat unit polymerase [Enterobacter bugandensis]|uniref:oligosaccharide repeat unit polymerase n=1 Tax=Enterobacter bugandensis TaxID=881260 RepID=UPI0020069415|nr:oligosaccharide repeat unit polymerase [Enterobacter bugandensis]MCK6894137.1 oligosaccharide repeat unit polymerase [Enterobacter bugandensis]